MNNTILVAAETFFGSGTYGVAQALRRLGWDVTDINEANFVPRHESVPLRVLRRALFSLYAAEYNRVVLRTAARDRPAAFLTVKGVHLTPRTLRELASMGIVTLNFYPDYHFSYRDFDERTLPFYDHVFTTKSFQIRYLEERLGKERVTFLAHGYTPEVHRPLPLTDEDRAVLGCDVGYVGSWSPTKERWLAAICRALPELDVRVWGPGWHRNRCDPVLRSAIRGFPLMGSRFAKAIAAAKVNLAIHKGPLRPGGWEDLVSTRSFEIPACGGFMLHVDNDEIREYYEPAEEIDVFSDEEGLVERIVHYLGNDALRREVAAKGHERAVPAYSFDGRMEVVAGFLERRLSTVPAPLR